MPTEGLRVPPPHLVLIRYGYNTPRLEPCPLRGCVVDGLGVSTCGHLACPNCGSGPPTVMDAPGPRWLEAYCDACGRRWTLQP